MNPQSNLHIFAPDFDFVYIGMYDEETGELIPDEKRTVANAQQLLNYSYTKEGNDVPRKETE
jgi:hypothetical protein